MATTRSGMSSPSAGEPLPALDDRIVHPGSRFEVLDGQLIAAPPANPPHATRHFSLAYVLGAHVGDGHIGAVDMLMQSDGRSDFAPDASIYPAGEAEGGGRKLKELAFEVTSEQALSVPTEKTRKLIARGVRRVFCILVKERRVLEWSRPTDNWSPLPSTATIDDPCLVRPLRVAALLDAATADDEVAEALARKHNPVIERIRAEGVEKGRAEGVEKGRAEGVEKGRAEALVTAITTLLDARGIPASAAALDRLRACRDEAKLIACLRSAATDASAENALARLA